MPDPGPSAAETSNSHFHVLTDRECLELLSTTTVGRVAFVDDGGVQLIPLNFAVIDEEIYFRTDPESALHTLAEGHDDVAFEIDHHGEVFAIGWNVTVKGSTERVSDPDLHTRAMESSRLRPWAGGRRGEVIHLTRRSVDGRRVRGS